MEGCVGHIDLRPLVDFRLPGAGFCPKLEPVASTRCTAALKYMLVHQRQKLKLLFLPGGFPGGVKAVQQHDHGGNFRRQKMFRIHSLLRSEQSQVPNFLSVLHRKF